MSTPLTLRKRAGGALPSLSLALASALFSSPATAQEKRSSDEAGANAPTDSSAQQLPHELEGIVVEGTLVQSPAAAPSTTTALSAEDLQKFEEDDVHQILLKVPGVQVLGEDGLGLRPNIGIRGTSPNRSTKVTLMEDGVLFGPAPYSAPAAYYFPLITRMDSIEVHKGGAQILFGPRALGGALNLITAPIEKGWNGAADISLGQYDSLKTHGKFGYATERTGFLLEAIHLGSSGFKVLDGGGDTGFDKNEFMAKWFLRSKPDAAIFQQLDVKLGVSTERSNETYLGLTEEDFNSSPYRRYVGSSLDQMNWYRGQTQVTYTIMPNDDWEINITGYRNQFSRNWFKLDSMGGATLDEILANPNSPSNQVYFGVLTGRANTESNDESLILTDNQRNYLSQGVDSKANLLATTGPVSHDVTVGARFHYDEVVRRHDENTYLMVGATEDSLGHLERAETNAIRLNRSRGSSHALALHVVDTVDWKNFTLTPGLRTEIVWSSYEDSLNPEVSNSRTQVGFMPGSGIHYSLTEKMAVLGGIYRGFGPVAPQAQREEAPLPQAETSTTWEGGTRYSSESTHAELVGFFVDYGNLTANCTQSRGCSSEQIGEQFDAGQVNVWGLESLVSQKWRVAQFEIPARASYTLSMSSFRSDFSSTNPEWGDVKIGDQLPYLPLHQGTLSSGISDPSLWSVDANLTFASGSREIAGSGSLKNVPSTDPYALVGLAAKVRAVKYLWFYGRVANLLNSAYLTSRRPHGARPGAPRWIHIGIKIEK